jgi:hypothetical protein
VKGRELPLSGEGTLEDERANAKSPIRDGKEALPMFSSFLRERGWISNGAFCTLLLPE